VRILHSFWSKPFYSERKKEKTYGGWRHRKYHFFSWALSCLTIKKIYGEIHLITDKKGRELLINGLQLPYSSVSTKLESLNHYPETLWAVGKLHTYSLQKEPFLHVDGDVYLWKRFNKRLINAELVGQHIDKEEGHYHFGIAQLKRKKIALLPEMKIDFEQHKKFLATNAGIIGGKNVDFFKAYSERAFWFIDQNLKSIKSDFIGANYAIIYEQYLFSVMARAKNIRIEHYFDTNRYDIKKVSRFMEKYNEKRFVHILGDNKSNFDSCRELEMQLILEFPEYYRRIIKFLE